MSNLKSTFHPIAPKPQEFFMQNSDIIAVATFTSSLENEEVATNKTQISAPHTNTAEIPVTTAKTHKKKQVKTGSVEDEGGWDDENTGLLISYLEENFSSYKRNKSHFAKTVSSKLFPGKSWEQIKNKLARLVTRYNDIKEKENQTGREAQGKWKWFERLDGLFGTCENHNPGFLVDGFSDDIQLFNDADEKVIKEETPARTQNTKKQNLSSDPLAEAMISMGSVRQVIWEKRLTFENEQFEKKQKIESEIREKEMGIKKEELEIERIKADALQKKMEFEIEQSHMEFQLRMKELDLKLMQYKSS
jgi:hypothetical protein